MYYVHYDLDCVCRHWVGGGIDIVFYAEPATSAISRQGKPRFITLWPVIHPLSHKHEDCCILIEKHVPHQISIVTTTLKRHLTKAGTNGCSMWCKNTSKRALFKQMKDVPGWKSLQGHSCIMYTHTHLHNTHIHIINTVSQTEILFSRKHACTY